MKDFSKIMFDIREGEGQRSILMFCYIFLIIASLMIVKPVRNSLFLIEFGVDKLPFVFVLTALFAVLFTWLYSRFTRRVRLNYTIAGTLLISVVSLLIFWLFFHLGYRAGWLLYAFYIWVAIFGLITSAQFWLLANVVFDAREAKRLFGFIGAGAISGGIVGGYLTNYLAPRLRTENLIFFCTGFLAICVALLWLIWKNSAREGYRERAQKEKISYEIRSTDNPLKLLFSSRHLTFLAGLIGVSVVVANFVDYQFSAVASRLITDTDHLTAFFGFWMSTLNIISLGIQLSLTGRVLKHLGVAASLFFLPAGIFLGAIGILVFPGLGSAILIKVSDGSFKHSINKAGMELLALPTPMEVKSKVKAFIDVFVDNLATGVAGLLLILSTIVLGLSVSQISVIVMGLVVLWVYLILRVKTEYLNAFRSAIEKRNIDLDMQSINLEDASVFGSLVKVLEGENERQILYVMELLEGVSNQELIPHLKRLINSPSDEVKAKVLDLAKLFEELDLVSEARDLTKSEDESVRTEAVRYLCGRSDDMIATLDRYLHHRDYRIRSSAMMCAARAWKEEKKIREILDLKDLLNKTLRKEELPTDEMERNFMMASAARFIGLSGNKELYPELEMLLRAESRDVVRAAVISAGQTRAKEFISILIDHLKTPGISGDSRHSLAEYGEEIVDTLDERIEDQEVNISIRRHIPRVLSLIGTQHAADLLLKNLEHSDLLLRHEVLKGLNQLKSSFPHLRTDRSLIENLILNETGHYYRYSTILAGWKSSRSRSKKNGEEEEEARLLLIRALQERLEKKLERIFRLLGLRYVHEEMLNSYRGVTSKRHRLRADAIEFLDNLLKPGLKRVIIPIVESDMEEDLTDRARDFYGFEIPAEDERVTLLLEDDDNWIKACALYFIAVTDRRQYLDIVKPYAESPDTVIRETSKYFLERIGQSG